MFASLHTHSQTHTHRLSRTSYGSARSRAVVVVVVVVVVLATNRGYDGDDGPVTPVTSVVRRVDIARQADIPYLLLLSLPNYLATVYLRTTTRQLYDCTFCI